MIAPPVFQRAPRIYPEVPAAEVEIPAPASRPAPPTTSMVIVIAPAIICLGLLVYFFYTLFSNSPNWYILLGFGGLLVGVFSGAANYFGQRSSYSRNTVERETRYR